MIDNKLSIISDKAVIGNNVTIGPFCVIGDNVVIKDNVRLISHVCIDGDTEIGEGTVIYPFSTVGFVNQDLKYKNEPTKTIVGKNNTIREHVTIHRGTVQDKGITKIGDNNLFMVATHVAHDCIIGSNCVLANGVGLAGHVKIGNHVIVGGQAGVHQFVRIGDFAMIGARTAVDADILPYSIILEERFVSLRGVNVRGLTRHNFSKSDIQNIKKVYAELFDGSKSFVDNKDYVIEKYKLDDLIKPIIDFLLEDNNRNYYMPKKD